MRLNIVTTIFWLNTGLRPQIMTLSERNKTGYVPYVTDLRRVNGIVASSMWTTIINQVRFVGCSVLGVIA